MFDKYNYKYTNIYNLEKYFAPFLKSGFGSTFLKVDKGGFFKSWIYI